MRFHLAQGYAASKILNEQNPPVSKWLCQLAQVNLYNGHRTVVVVVVHLAHQTVCMQFTNLTRMLVGANHHKSCLCIHACHLPTSPSHCHLPGTLHSKQMAILEVTLVTHGCISISPVSYM